MASCLLFLHHLMDPQIQIRKANPPVPNYQCIRDIELKDPQPYQVPHIHKDDSRYRFQHRALVILESSNSKNGNRIRHFLSSLRIDSKMEVKTRNLPTLSNKKAGRFAVIVFENYNSYLYLDKWNRQILDKYCLDYQVSIIGFVSKPDTDSLPFNNVDQFRLTFQYNLQLEDYKFNADSDLWRVVKPGEIWTGFLPDEWTVFHPNHSTYQPLAFTKLSSKFLEFQTDEDAEFAFKYIPALYDQGKIDGISRVLLGSDLNFWIHKMIFLDALSFLTSGRLELGLERYIQIDIDDIFVGKEGIRMKVPDVEVSKLY